MLGMAMELVKARRVFMVVASTHVRLASIALSHLPYKPLGAYLGPCTQQLLSAPKRQKKKQQLTIPYRAKFVRIIYNVMLRNNKQY
jgi:hypothetical protein